MTRFLSCPRAWAGGLRSLVTCVLLLTVGAASISGCTNPDMAMADVLRYHTHYVATIDAQVEQIALVSSPIVDTELWLGQRKSPQESIIRVPSQEIRLRVTQIIRFEERSVNPPTPSFPLSPDARIGVSNPFTDQQPPFQVGDTIRVRLRFVSPESVLRADDTRSHWWFYPPGQPEEVAPPRFPFEGIKFLN